MMDARRAKLIAEVIRHLEDLDAEELSSGMKKPEEAPEMGEPEEMADGEMPKVGGPMEEAVEAAEPKSEEDIDDDELEELAKLSG